MTINNVGKCFPKPPAACRSMEGSLILRPIFYKHPLRTVCLRRICIVCFVDVLSFVILTLATFEVSCCTFFVFLEWRSVILRSVLQVMFTKQLDESMSRRGSLHICVRPLNARGSFTEQKRFPDQSMNDFIDGLIDSATGRWNIRFCIDELIFVGHCKR